MFSLSFGLKSMGGGKSLRSTSVPEPCKNITNPAYFCSFQFKPLLQTLRLRPSCRLNYTKHRALSSTQREISLFSGSSQLKHFYFMGSFALNVLADVAWPGSFGARALKQTKTWSLSSPAMKQWSFCSFALFKWSLSLKVTLPWSLLKRSQRVVELCTLNKMTRHWSSRFKGEKPRGLNLTYETARARALKQKSHGAFFAQQKHCGASDLTCLAHEQSCGEPPWTIKSWSSPPKKQDLLELHL
jgi:hypothetical protein